MTTRTLQAWDGTEWVNVGVVPSASAHTRQTFSDAHAVISSSTRYMAQTGTLTAPRVVSLPSASAAGAGAEIIVADESGSASPTAPINVTVAARTSDTINGSASYYPIGAPYGWRRFISSGSAWFFDEGVLRVSQVTAKGDILVGTGAGAVANLPVGQDGYSLMANPATQTGLTWKSPRFTTIPVGNFWLSAMYYTVVGVRVTQGQAVLWPIWVPHNMTVSEVRLNVYSAGTTGMAQRLALYTTHSNGYKPDSLIADLGTFATDSTGVKAFTGLSLNLTQGWIWGAVICTTTLASSGQLYFGMSNTQGSWDVSMSCVATTHYYTGMDPGGGAPSVMGSYGGLHTGAAPSLEFKRSA